MQFLSVCFNRFRSALYSSKSALCKISQSPSLHASLNIRFTIKGNRLKLKGLIVKTNLLAMFSMFLLLSLASHLRSPIDLSFSLYIFLS